jgi:hypothetical protein
MEHNMKDESMVKDVRKWYNKTTMIQAINSIVPTRSTFVNDLAFEFYQQVKEYNIKLHNPLNHIAPKSYKQADPNGSPRKIRKEMGLLISIPGDDSTRIRSLLTCARKHFLLITYMTSNGKDQPRIGL